MNWRFWEPKHTVQTVAKQLLDGLRDGSIVIGEPLLDEPLEAETDVDKIVLQLDVPQEMSNEEILEVVKRCVRGADEENRNHGGQGLSLEAIRVDRPKVKVALRAKGVPNRLAAV
jgi:hypothetical protein